jgi:osmoprotectant transport system ATP-binding protein
VDDFVARFIGADRGIKLLALRRLDELPLSPPDGAVAPVAPGSTTLRDALSLMITQHARSVVVVEDDGGAPKGVVTLDVLAELVR